MADWRYLRRWTDEELESALARARYLAPNFDPGEQLVPERGWNRVQSRAIVAREPAGPPIPGGPFERLWLSLRRFQHSDPRIVVPHHRGALGPCREVMLELRVLGLRFLCPVRIAGRRESDGPDRTERSFCIETLDGHVERGREWFHLEKDHGSGDIRFRIEAGWREGDFPNRWSWLGFELLGRRYQRAWHRLCHLRLRRIGAGLNPDRRIGASGIRHEEGRIPTEPVQFVAQRGFGREEIEREIGLEHEEEEMRRDRIWRAAGLGALAGVRSLSPPALLASRIERRGRPVLSGRQLPFRLGPALSALALGELVVDKLPATPPRTRPVAVAARAFSGALVGSATARRRESKLAPAIVGAAAATAATWASYALRRLGIRRSKALGYAVALAEDALVLWGGRRLVRAATRPARPRLVPVP